MKLDVIEAFDFSRSEEQRQGETPVKELPRLANECVDQSGILQWRLSGGTHASGHPQLNVQINGKVQLICQRCLKQFAYDLASESVLALAHDDEQADQMELTLDDDTLDVIVGVKAMPILDLVEDEALLAIPQAPKHGQCPGQVVADTPEVTEYIEIKPSPFAVLQKLKH